MNDVQPELPFGGPDKFLSEEDAIKALAETRRWLVEKAHRIAVELATQFGYVYGQMILAELDRRKAWTQAEQTIRTTWLGVVFKAKEYKELWEPIGYIKAGNKKRNAHAHAVALWKLKGKPTPDFERLGLKVQLIEDDVVSDLSDGEKQVALAALRRVWGHANVYDQATLTKLGKWLSKSMKKGK